MDNQTLGAAIALCDAQIDKAIAGIVGSVDEVIIRVQDNGLIITEKEGE